jgi:hypothetical protein
MNVGTGKGATELTNGCLQVVQTMLLAASLIFAWLFGPVFSLAFRSRFCCALAPCDTEVSREKLQ